ncbi:unnamed protein product, partial [Polarella glacialis]
LSQVLGTSFKGWPDVMVILNKANASSEAYKASVEDCALGLAAVLLHSLPGIESSQGQAGVQRAYEEVSRIRSEVSQFEESDCRWTRMVNHGMFAHYPMLLGIDARFIQQCPPDAPRIFVYDMKGIADQPLSCARIGFWASEVYIDRFLRHSPCRVLDWRKADLFFAPAYLTCWELQKTRGFTLAEKDQSAQALADQVRDLPHWKRREGLDHVFLFGASAWQLPRWRDLFARSIVLAVESRPIFDCPSGKDVYCKHCEDCFQPWKDLVMPPVTPRPVASSLLSHSKPMEDRQYVMAWHGQHAEAADEEVRRAYTITNETVRLELLRNLG